MTKREITRRLRLRASVTVPVTIGSKKSKFLMNLRDLAESRTTIDDAVASIEDKIDEIQSGESRFSKKFAWDIEEKEFKEMRK